MKTPGDKSICNKRFLIIGPVPVEGLGFKGFGVFLFALLLTAHSSGVWTGGLAWLMPLVDGHPPVGWATAGAYLVMPVLLTASQYISLAIIRWMLLGVHKGDTG